MSVGEGSRALVPAAAPVPFWRLLLRSRKFWLAVVGLGQSILFAFWPGFPSQVWQSIDALLAVLIASIAVEDAAGLIGAGISDSERR